MLKKNLIGVHWIPFTSWSIIEVTVSNTFFITIVISPHICNTSLEFLVDPYYNETPSFDENVIKTYPYPFGEMAREMVAASGMNNFINAKKMTCNVSLSFFSLVYFCNLVCNL